MKDHQTFEKNMQYKSQESKQVDSNIKREDRMYKENVIKTNRESLSILL